jgi:hypothetical protein
VSVVPLVAAVLELKKTRLESIRWLNERYIGGEETLRLLKQIICWRGLIFEAIELRIFEHKPLLQSGPYLLLKKGGGGLFSGGYSTYGRWRKPIKAIC